MLQQLLDLHPAQLTVAELVRELGGEQAGLRRARRDRTRRPRPRRRRPPAPRGRASSRRPARRCASASCWIADHQALEPGPQPRLQLRRRARGAGILLLAGADQDHVGRRQSSAACPRRPGPGPRRRPAPRAATPALASEATVMTRLRCASRRAGSRSEAQRSRKPIRAGARTRTLAAVAVRTRPWRAILPIAAGSSTGALDDQQHAGAAPRRGDCRSRRGGGRGPRRRRSRPRPGRRPRRRRRARRA